MKYLVSLISVFVQPSRTAVHEVVTKFKVLIRVHRHKFHFCFCNGQQENNLYEIHVIVNQEV